VSWGISLFVVFALSVIAYCLWNWGYRKGKTGSTIGNALLKYKVVRANDGLPIRFGGKRVAKIIASIVFGAPRAAIVFFLTLKLIFGALF
jgi:RDD family